MANSQQLPEPHSSIAGRNTLDPSGKNAFAAFAAKFRPKNVILEIVAATVARFALRLIDQSTGKAYSANELAGYLFPDGDSSFRTISATNAFFRNLGITNASDAIGYVRSTNLTNDRNYELPDLAGSFVVIPSPASAYIRTLLGASDDAAARDTLNISTKFSDLGSSGFLPPGVYPDAKKHHFIYRKSGSNISGPLSIVLPAAGDSIVGQTVTLFSATNITTASTTVSGGGTILGASFTTVTSGTVYEWTCIETGGTGTWIRTR